MLDATDIITIKKAMAYDLIWILKRKPDQTYTAKDVEALLDAYIKGVER